MNISMKNYVFYFAIISIYITFALNYLRQIKTHINTIIDFSYGNST